MKHFAIAIALGVVASLATTSSANQIPLTSRQRISLHDDKALRADASVISRYRYLRLVGDLDAAKTWLETYMLKSKSKGAYMRDAADLAFEMGDFKLALVYFKADRANVLKEQAGLSDNGKQMTAAFDQVYGNLFFSLGQVPRIPTSSTAWKGLWTAQETLARSVNQSIVRRNFRAARLLMVEAHRIGVSASYIARYEKDLKAALEEQGKMRAQYEVAKAKGSGVPPPR